MSVNGPGFEHRGNPNVRYVPRTERSYAAPVPDSVGTVITATNAGLEWLRGEVLRELAMAASPMHEFAAALSSALGGLDGSGPRTEDLLFSEWASEARPVTEGEPNFPRFVRELEASMEAHGGLAKDPQLLNLTRGLLDKINSQVERELDLLSGLASGRPGTTGGTTGTGLELDQLAQLKALLLRWQEEVRSAMRELTARPAVRSDHRLGFLMLRSEVRGIVTRAVAQLNRLLGRDWDATELIQSPQVMPHFAEYVALLESQRGSRTNGCMRRDGDEPVIVYRGPTRYQLRAAATEFESAMHLFRDVQRAGPDGELVLVRRGGGGYERTTARRRIVRRT